MGNLLSELLTQDQVMGAVGGFLAALVLLGAAWVRQRAARYLTPKDLAKLDAAAQEAVSALAEQVAADPSDVRKRDAHDQAVRQVQRVAGRVAKKAGRRLLDAAVMAAVKRGKGWT